MLLFGPYLVETAVWILATTIIAVWVTRVYIHALLAITLGKVKNNISAVKQKTNAPFVTIFLPIYNEVNVIDRLLAAVTTTDYPNYEIIIADDSTDKSMVPHLKLWQEKGIKVVHRNVRVGFKAGALNNAMKFMDKRSRYLVLLDADYVPQSDTVSKLLEDFSRGEVSAVQGYTKHTLNASQNAFTKSVSLAFSSYCLSDIAARRKLNGFLPLAGSAFAISKESLVKVGGFNESSITEDWELSTRLVANGYRIVYDESIGVAAECPSTFNALVKQQMRWAEGIVRDTKNNFFKMVYSKKANGMKKFDYLFYGFSSINGVWGSLSYVLTAYVFLISQGIIVALGVDRSLIAGLGFYGQFLLFIAPVYIPIGLIFSACVGLYRENRLSHLPWCTYLFMVSLTLSPFIAYAGIKGLIFQRGSWARTPKTGRLTNSED